MTTACALPMNMLLPSMTTTLQLLLADANLSPALMAGITGIGPCIEKLQTAGTVFTTIGGLCPTACAAPAPTPAPTPTPASGTLSPEGAAVRGAAASSGIALVVAAAAASAM